MPKKKIVADVATDIALSQEIEEPTYVVAHIDLFATSCIDEDKTQLGHVVPTIINDLPEFEARHRAHIIAQEALDNRGDPKSCKIVELSANDHHLILGVVSGDKTILDLIFVRELESES